MHDFKPGDKVRITNDATDSKRYVGAEAVVIEEKPWHSIKPQIRITSGPHAGEQWGWAPKWLELLPDLKAHHRQITERTETLFERQTQACPEWRVWYRRKNLSREEVVDTLKQLRKEFPKAELRARTFYITETLLDEVSG